MSLIRGINFRGRETVRFVVATIAIVACSAIISAFKFDALNYSIFILIGLWGAFPLIGLSFMLVAFWQWKRDRSFAVLCITAAVSSNTAFFATPPELLFRIRFAILRQSYAAHLKEILDTKSGKQGFTDFIRYEAGPPERVAFCICNSGHGNWLGQVYDPSGIVMRSNEITRENYYDSNLAPIREMFGGSMNGAIKVGEHWYVCWFN